MLLPATNSQFISVVETDGAPPEILRKADISYIKDVTGDKFEPHFVLHFYENVGRPPLIVKTPYSFDAIRRVYQAK